MWAHCHMYINNDSFENSFNMTSETLTLFLVIFRSKSSKRRLRGSKPRTVSANCPTVSRLSQLLSPPCCRWPARVWLLTPLHSPRFSPRRPAPLSPLWRARKWCSPYSRRFYDGRCRYRQPDVSAETDNQMNRTRVLPLSQVSGNMFVIKHFGKSTTSRRGEPS